MHALLLAVLAASACDCRSDVERCEQTRAASEQAWQAYLDVLERELAEARKTAADTRAALAEIELRLSEQVKKEVDQRRDRWDPAWLRAYDAALVTACREDAICAALRAKESDAKIRIEDIEPRIAAVRRVLAVTHEMPAASAEAAAAVDADGGRSEIVRARQFARDTAVACEGVRLPNR